MEGLKSELLDLDKLVENLAQSPYFTEGEIKAGNFAEETNTFLNKVRSYLKGVFPDKRGKIPLIDGSYIFVEYGRKDRIRNLKMLFERYERLKLRIKPGHKTRAKVANIKIEYYIAKVLTGENAGKIYEYRKDWIKDGEEWVESDLSRVLLSEYFRKNSITVTPRHDIHGNYQAWRLLLGKLEEIFRSQI